MKMHRTITACLALVTLTLASLIASDAHAVDEGWTVSFAEAKAQAAKEGKKILMEFTGSDWCPPCKALHAKVLSQEAFKTEAPKNFILLKLDNPRDKSHQTVGEQAQYRKLSAQYKVSGVPTIILADDQGRPYHRQVGYSGAPAAKYVADLNQKSTVLAKRNESLAKADQAEGVDRATLLDQAIGMILAQRIEVLARADQAEGAERAQLVNQASGLVDMELAISTYVDTVKEIITLDAKGTAGLKAKYEKAVQVAEITTALTEIQGSLRNGTPDEAIAKIDKLLAEKKPTGEGLQEILYLKSLVKFKSGDKETAQKLLEEAKAAAPNSKRATNIDEVLKNVFKVGK